MSSTLAEAPAAPPAPPPARPPGSRFQRWLASWRISLKMARRDSMRYRGRSLLVIIMVALPVGMIIGGLTFAMTSTRSLEERLPWMLGNAQAVIHGVQSTPVTQGADGRNFYAEYEGEIPKAKPIPGFTEDASNAAKTAALSALIPGTLVPVDFGEFRWTDGKKRPYGTVMYVDPTVDLGSKLQLISGRWPTSDTEVAVTPAGQHNGFPASGRVEIGSGETKRMVTVVGVANAHDDQQGMPSIVMSSAPEDGNSWGASWLVKRDTPVTWDEVRKLNEYGVSITSADVVKNPPPAGELPRGVYDQQAQANSDLKLMAALLGAVLFLVTALLVGPAFAVSAGRQRRSLALAASNGAEVRQLRRSVLAGALILGALAAVVGAALGAATVAAAVAVWQGMRPWSTLFGAFDIPWVPSVIVLVCAILAALTAALIPALRLGRLDIVGVMKGQNVSPKLNRVLPVIGIVLFALGAAGLLLGVTSNSVTAAVAGVFGLVIGAVCLIPLLLVTAGRLAGRLPVAVRMATRDAARQRHRSAPTVAALMAGAALLSTFAIGLESNDRFQAKNYEPQTVAGEGSLYAEDGEAETLIATVRTIAPTWRVVQQRYIGPVWDDNKPPTSEPFVAVVPPNCRPEQTVPPEDPQNGMVTPQDDPCRRTSSTGYYGTTGASIMLLPAAEIARRLDLDKADAAAVAAGTVLVADPKLITDGNVELALGSGAVRENEQTKFAVTRTAKVPALIIPERAYDRGATQRYFGLVMADETAADLKIDTAPSELHVYDTRGPISAADETKVKELLSEGGMYIERGYQRADKWLMLGILGIAGLLLVIVTLISTALALAEQQADMGTLAAVGATKGTRRRFAAAQAGTVAVIGGVLGIAIGLVAGVAVAWPSTTTYWNSQGEQQTVAPTIGIPITPMLIILLGVPLIAAAIAAASIRRAPGVTRRGN